MSSINLAEIFTTTVVSGTFEVPDGATEIFLNNIGNGDASWEGSRKVDGVPSVPVVLKPDSTFAYGYVGRGRKGFLIDATATTLEISITF